MKPSRAQTRARVNTGQLGTLYLLHFSPPLKHARHYLGWTDRDPLERAQEHIDGSGSPLVAAAAAAGCHIELARVTAAVTGIGSAPSASEKGLSVQLKTLRAHLLSLRFQLDDPEEDEILADLVGAIDSIAGQHAKHARSAGAGDLLAFSVEHLIRVGVEETINAHEAVEELRRNPPPLVESNVQAPYTYPSEE